MSPMKVIRNDFVHSGIFVHPLLNRIPPMSCHYGNQNTTDDLGFLLEKQISQQMIDRWEIKIRYGNDSLSEWIKNWEQRNNEQKWI